MVLFIYMHIVNRKVKYLGLCRNAGPDFLYQGLISDAVLSWILSESIDFYQLVTVTLVQQELMHSLGFGRST